ncbi:MAG TPA: SGNH/GDSL hydrolase family protein [Pirellulales bacterium]
MPFRLSAVCLTILMGLTTIAGARQPGAKPARPRAVNPALLPIEDNPKLPRVLLIGDSISIGYTLPVRKLLAGRANVHRIPANGADTRTGVAKIDSWLGSDKQGNDKWDVIHFNWGLHDIKHSEAGNQVPLGQYRQNLEQLVERLERTGARLIWASTTPVPNAKLSPERRSADVLAYNAAAKKIMQDHHIAVDDLYIFALPQLTGIQIPANVHFTPEGSQALAERVAASLDAALTLGPPGKAAETSAK